MNRYEPLANALYNASVHQPRPSWNRASSLERQRFYDIAFEIERSNEAHIIPLVDRLKKLAEARRNETLARHRRGIYP